MIEPWLIVLDIDGTVLREDGSISDSVIAEVQRVNALGHEVMFATGRSVSMTLTILARFGIKPLYLVCSNGAITLKRDDATTTGYSRIVVDSFDPSEVLTTIRGSLGEASYAVEDEEGFYRFTGFFPTDTLGVKSEKVEFAELMVHQATRVVVISPEHAIEEFLSIVERMGLHKVTYTVGFTSWLDIAPDGVNKATALERVRQWHEIPPERVLAVGDGRNDIEMLSWAAKAGRGIAMGHAPDEVVAAANETTASDLEDGVALLFATV